MEVLTWTNSLQVEYTNWQRNLKLQKLLQDISNKYLGSPKQLKLTYCDIRGLNYLIKNTRKKRSHTKPRLGNNKPCRNDQYQGQTPYKNKRDHKLQTSNRPPHSNNYSRCSKCGDTAHHEEFTCPAKKYQCKACHKFGHFTSQCFQRKQHSQHKYRWPKAHQIQVDDVYDNPDSYPSDLSSSEDSFCLQVKIKRQPERTQKIQRPISCSNTTPETSILEWE